MKQIDLIIKNAYQFKASFFKRIVTCQCSAEITGSDYNSSISVIKS